MAHVSSKKLKKEVFKKAKDQFAEAILLLKTKENQKKFLDDFLTPTEKVMLGKRLCLILMLSKNYSFEKISKTLKMSPSTIARFWKEIKNSKHSLIIEKVESKNEATEAFWKGLESFMRFGMTPKYGRGRWDFLNNLSKPNKLKK